MVWSTVRKTLTTHILPIRLHVCIVPTVMPVSLAWDSRLAAFLSNHLDTHMKNPYTRIKRYNSINFKRGNNVSLSPTSRRRLRIRFTTNKTSSDIQTPKPSREEAGECASARAVVIW